jgi:hypothetical protein
MAVTGWGQGFDEPSRALAQKIASVLKTREPISLIFSTSSSDSDVALERELRGLGLNRAAQADVTVTVTLSENFRGLVWVAEIRRGDAREVVMEEWPRPPATAAAISLVIEKKLLLEQESRILDLAPLGHGLLVLDAESVSVYENSQRKMSIRLLISRPLPRDLRGRLFVQGDVYQAYLPGLTCNGNAANGLSITCRDEGLWPLAPNVRGISIPTRNFFENFVMPDGLQKRMPPFFTAVQLADHNRPEWVFSGTDGRARFYNAAFEPGPTWSGWGSDLAVIESECGSRTLLLATGTGDSTAPDSVQALEWTGGAPRPVADPVSFPGPVTALWTASERGAALAVSRDPKSGRYAAFRLAIPCSR